MYCRGAGDGVVGASSGVLQALGTLWVLQREHEGRQWGRWGTVCCGKDKRGCCGEKGDTRGGSGGRWGSVCCSRGCCREKGEVRWCNGVRGDTVCCSRGAGHDTLQWQ